MTALVAFFCGAIFGLGLVISQMINPAKVIAFLDFAGKWDPTLAFVFFGALAVALPFYQWTLKNRSQPVVADEFHVPDNSTIDLKLIGGAAVFGVGWGLAGFCPGPGLTAIVTFAPSAFVFVISMLAGMATYRFILQRGG